MARLKDIAEATGLSVNTVSLALRQSSRIAEQTRDRVLSAAEALDYTPNHAAKSLVSRRTMSIGLLLTDITSPILTQVARSVELELKGHGYVTLLAASNDDLEEERRALRTFRARQVDGILVYPRNLGELDHIRRLRRSGYPLVLLAGSRLRGLDVVCVDESAGAQTATEDLIARGHRRIGLIYSDRLNGNNEKTAGFLRAHHEAGLPHLPELLIDPQGDTVATGYEAFARMMAVTPPPTAVLASNDRLALGGLRWCDLNSVRVPEDLAIFGFDNIEYGAFASTPLSSVDYPVGALARQAVERLLALVKRAGATPAPEVTRIAPSLVLRESHSI